MKPFIIITGMHRSGTSFLARALNLSGVYIGELENMTNTELKANDANPKGHWENWHFLKIGREIRKDTNFKNRNKNGEFQINEKIGSKIKNEVESKMKVPSLASGFKDPFACIYLDSWLDFMPENTIIIGIFRHPLKVAESLKNRDGMDYEKALNMWKNHNQGLLKGLEKGNGFLLNFDWPRDKIFSELDMIREKIGLLDTDLSDWYEKDLKRSDKTFQSEKELGPKARSIYNQLLQTSKKNKEVLVDKHQFNENELKGIIKESIIQSQKLTTYFKKILKER